MFDMNNLLNLVKKAAVEAVNASNPCDYCYGKVASSNPLKIVLEQKIVLNKNQLAVTYTARNLNIGDKVVLMKKAGGQEYLVLDRMVNL